MMRVDKELHELYSPTCALARYPIPLPSPWLRKKRLHTTHISRSFLMPTLSSWADKGSSGSSKYVSSTHEGVVFVRYGGPDLSRVGVYVYIHRNIRILTMHLLHILSIFDFPWMVHVESVRFSSPQDADAAGPRDGSQDSADRNQTCPAGRNGTPRG